MSDFTARAKEHFRGLSDDLLNGLRPGEELTLNLNAEETLFVRFNGNRVRQNTDVEQANLSLKLQADGRTVEKSRTLGGNLGTDLESARRLLAAAREEIGALPKDPNQVPLANNGSSEEDYRGRLLSRETVVPAVVEAAAGTDLAGLYSGGSLVRANRNSRGQSHWFATENFVLDYSLYQGPKAAKGIYAGSAWEPAAWKARHARTREALARLDRPTQNVAPGRYRTYLAPAAMSELLRMMSWGALSAAAWKQGRSPFQKLVEGKAKFSPLFSARENFGLGLTPRFNALGEVAASQIPLFEKGEFRQFLVSSRSAKEHGLTGNAANDEETARSLEVSPGELPEERVLAELGTGLYLSNLHYLNWSDPVNARVTGMTRYACFWVENGEIAGPIRDLRWDESLFEALGPKLMALTAHAEVDPVTETYFSRQLGGSRVPGALIDEFTFTL